MVEATWSDDAKTPPIDWRMSAALENVPLGDDELAEVTNLEAAVRAWCELDADHRKAAVLTPERSVQIDGAAHSEFTGEGIAALAERLPNASRTG